MIRADNYVSGRFVPPSSGGYLTVSNPATSDPVGYVALSSKSDVDAAVSSARAAFVPWSRRTVKSRSAVLLRFHSLIVENARELADLIVLENGKNITEALADVAKGNETVEYAASMPQLFQGRTLRVSGTVNCLDRRDALGVVVSVAPFNFPLMVPMWTVPIALACGNAVILKPSEKVPLTMRRVAELLAEAGLPDGVFNMVQGTAECVEALIDHEDVRCVFFGSLLFFLLYSLFLLLLSPRVLLRGYGALLPPLPHPLFRGRGGYRENTDPPANPPRILLSPPRVAKKTNDLTPT